MTSGVEMDVLGMAYSEFREADREAIVAAYPRGPRFKKDILQAFYDGIHHKPHTTFGNVKGDVLRYEDPDFEPIDFCCTILGSHWAS